MERAHNFLVSKENTCLCVWIDFRSRKDSQNVYNMKFGYILSELLTKIIRQNIDQDNNHTKYRPGLKLKPKQGTDKTTNQPGTQEE